MNQYAPYHPIIYIRGFAGTQGEIEDTVGDPYMGFNVGSTKSRRSWDGSMRRYYFESPLVRLKDEPIWQKTETGFVQLDGRYDDVYVGGDDLTAAHPEDPEQPLRTDITLPYQSIAILRYYDSASVDFGDGKSHAIEDFARQLSDLILRLKRQVCRKGGRHPLRQNETLDNEVAPENFRVYLLAHSMGGLVCRAFLQNNKIGSPEARAAVDKLFTYATPHNGIDLRIVRNIPGWSSLGDATNFNRERMAGYLGLAASTPEVSEVRGFDPKRIFNLIGTNPADYLVGNGLSSWAVGDASDGLVRIANATTFGAIDGQRVESPRAHVHRSHSGQFGILNSEEGYQNLTRFLFGSVRADGFFDVDDVTLPDEVQAAYDHDQNSVKASYRFEVVASIRGSQWQLHRRVGRENSAIQRSYDELFPKDVDGFRRPDKTGSPQLFSVFLDPAKSQHQDGSVAFAFDISVLVPEYEINGILWLRRHFEGGYLVRKLIVIEAVPDKTALGGWRLEYGSQSETPNSATIIAKTTADGRTLKFSIPIASSANARPGIVGYLRIHVNEWR